MEQNLITAPAIFVLVVIATLGHAMAFMWYLAVNNNWKICERTIYDLPFKKDQVRRELINSVHTPIHAVALLVYMYLGFFANRSWISFWPSVLVTFVGAEIWHYGSHRAFHLKSLHWIHLEHHKSLTNSPFTAISFSLWEKLIFDIGLLGILATVDYLIYSLNFFGIAAWYVGYLIINSFSHANFELHSSDYNSRLGKFLTSTTYHSLHHSRYTGNYGLGTRLLDKLFKTEWDDYERLYERICRDEVPLTTLREKVES
jgi:Delta7-sterol 5-desaturase